MAERGCYPLHGRDRIVFAMSAREDLIRCRPERGSYSMQARERILFALIWTEDRVVLGRRIYHRRRSWWRWRGRRTCADYSSWYTPLTASWYCCRSCFIPCNMESLPRICLTWVMTNTSIAFYCALWEELLLAVGAVTYFSLLSYYIEVSVLLSCLYKILSANFEEGRVCFCIRIH